MAEEDDFDIDIYGDEQPEFVHEPAEQIEEDVKHEDSTFEAGLDGTNFGKPPNEPETEPGTIEPAAEDYNMDGNNNDDQNHGGATYQAGSESATNPDQTAPHADQQNGNESGLDPNATAALRLSELQWWETEDDLRGWANECSVEGQIKELTFNEHKANGKSKGEVFIEFETAQAATALKRKMESLAGSQPARKYTILYTNPGYNPFKTYPKDGPARGKEPFKERQQGSYVQPYNQNNFRGRGGYNNVRGNMHMNRGGFNNHNQAMGAMGGYGGMNNMMGMNQGGGYGNQMAYNRGGGMMGNRGGFPGNRGRGGMMGDMNMGIMPNMMGNMGSMNGMGMGMGMGMGAGMGMNGECTAHVDLETEQWETSADVKATAYPQGQFNPQFFGGNGTQSMSPGNPHGAKRQREG
ncbi:hypothetical protein MBLNU457_4781t1 [Dothideomycetes sp. NU457]